MLDEPEKEGENSVSRTAIVGAGVIGLATAWELSQRGEEVVILDRKEPGAGSSTGNAGWITPSISYPLPQPGLVGTALKWMLQPESPLYIKPRLDPGFVRWLWQFFRYSRPEPFLAGFEAMLELNRGTMAGFDRYKEQGIDFEMHRAGLFFLSEDERDLERAYQDVRPLESLGYKIPKLLSGDEVRELEPVASDTIAGGYLVEEERQVRPESLVRGLAAAVKEAGVEIRTGAEVTGARHRGSRIATIETTAGDVDADRVVIAAGAWSGVLGKRLGVKLPIEAGKGYSITIDEPNLMPNHAWDLISVRVAITPFDGSLRLAGTMELSGLNLRQNRRRVNAIWKNAARHFNEQITGSRMRAWVGMRSLTPDGLPIIGRAPDVKNVYVATGHQMLGVTLAPATGLAMSQLIIDGKAETNLAPFDPARFG